MTTPPDAAVVCENLGFTYPGAESAALEAVSLRVERGERAGILGPNGGGKSTLLKLVLGLLDGYSGSIRVLGMSPREARRAGAVGYVAQHAEVERAMPLTARQVVELAAGWRLKPWASLDRPTAAWVSRLIALVGAEPFADRPIGKLSGGQFQRVMIARALAPKPQILVLDEPMVGIDAAGQAQFAELLARVHAELTLTLLVVSHDLRAIAAGSDRVACLARRLHSHVSPRGLTPQVLAEVFSHDVAGILSTSGPVHIHAHAAAECTDCGHDHAAHAPPAAPTPLRIDPVRGEGRS